MTLQEIRERLIEITSWVIDEKNDHAIQLSWNLLGDINEAIAANSQITTPASEDGA